MTKRFRVILSAAVVLAAAFTVWEVWPSSRIPDPVFQGRRLSQWLDDVDPQTRFLLNDSAIWAIRHLGSNAVPRLLAEASADRPFHPSDILVGLLKRQHWLRLRTQTSSDHQNRALRGFRALRELGARGVAEGLTNSDWRVRHGCLGQWELAMDYPAILFGPMVGRLNDPEPKVRARAANIAGVIGQEPEKAVPTLIELLSDSNERVRCMAALGLAGYGEQAKAAVPVLLQNLTNCTSSDFRYFANALKCIDPKALASAGLE